MVPSLGSGRWTVVSRVGRQPSPSWAEGLPGRAGVLLPPMPGSFLASSLLNRVSTICPDILGFIFTSARHRPMGMPCSALSSFFLLLLATVSPEATSHVPCVSIYRPAESDTRGGRESLMPEKFLR